MEDEPFFDLNMRIEGDLLVKEEVLDLGSEIINPDQIKEEASDEEPDTEIDVGVETHYLPNEDQPINEPVIQHKCILCQKIQTKRTSAFIPCADLDCTESICPQCLVDALRIKKFTRCRGCYRKTYPGGRVDKWRRCQQCNGWQCRQCAERGCRCVIRHIISIHKF